MWRRLVARLRAGWLDADVSEELRFHAEMKTRDTSDPNAAARAVGRSLHWRELARDACRVLVRRDRASSIAAVVTLALAIGLNGVVFTIVDAMLVRGFPLVKDNDRLVMVQEIFPSFARGVSFPDFGEWRAQARSFNDMCAVASGRRVAFRDQAGGPVDLTIWTETANTFRLLGVVPILGRDFVRADEVAGAAPVVILSYRFWASGLAKAPPLWGRRCWSAVCRRRSSASCQSVSSFRTKSNVWMPAVRTPELERRGAGGGGYVARSGAVVRVRRRAATCHWRTTRFI